MNIEPGEESEKVPGTRDNLNGRIDCEKVAADVIRSEISAKVHRDIVHEVDRGNEVIPMRIVRRWKGTEGPGQGTEGGASCKGRKIRRRLR